MLRQIAPVFFTMDIPATLAYYTGKLGFGEEKAEFRLLPGICDQAAALQEKEPALRPLGKRGSPRYERRGRSSAAPVQSGAWGRAEARPYKGVTTSGQGGLCGR